MVLGINSKYKLNPALYRIFLGLFYSNSKILSLERGLTYRCFACIAIGSKIIENLMNLGEIYENYIKSKTSTDLIWWKNINSIGRFLGLQEINSACGRSR
jgi:hypothetical protein